MDYVRSFRSLEVYKLSRHLSKEIFEISNKFPKEEMFPLLIRLEGHLGLLVHRLLRHGQKENMKHFVSKLTDADGEQLQTQHWVEVASDCCYISQEAADNVLQNCASIGRMLNSMIAKASTFCNPANPNNRLPNQD
jgi:hypothetical protein